MKIKCLMSARGRADFRGSNPKSWAYCPYDGRKVRLEQCQQCKYYGGEAETIGIKSLQELSEKKDKRWVKTLNMTEEATEKPEKEDVEWLKEEIASLRAIIDNMKKPEG